MLSAPRENFAPRRELMDTQLSFHVSSSQRQLKRAQTGCLTAAGSSAYMEPSMGD